MLQMKKFKYIPVFEKRILFELYVAYYSFGKTWKNTRQSDKYDC